MPQPNRFKISAGSLFLPDPDADGVEIGVHDVYPENTGRDTEGTMQGEIKCLKRTFNLKWTALTETQAETIMTVLRPGNAQFGMDTYVTLTFYHIPECWQLDQGVFGTETFEVYVGADRTYRPRYDSHGNEMWDLELELIER